METKSLDFGTLRIGMRATPQVIRLVNRGSGELAARAHATNPALRVTANDDAVTVEPDLTRAASLAGDVVITSAGGRAVVSVAGRVEDRARAGDPPGKTLDFGTLPVGAWSTLQFRVENAGTGNLQWEGKGEGSFLQRAERRRPRHRQGHGLRRAAGQLHRQHLIKSNGGDATINVRLEVVAEHAEPTPAPPPIPGPPVPPPLPVNLCGWWQSPNGKFNVTGVGPIFQYTDFNLFGMQVGGGTLTVNGPQVFMQGTALLIPYTAQLIVNGPVMSGTAMCLGSQNPVVYTRC